MSRLVFDIETDGFVKSMKKIHCICTLDLDTDEARTYRSDDEDGIEPALSYLTDAGELIGHNIVKFDIPAIQKLHPGFSPKGRITDTLTISRIAYANLKQVDAARKMNLGKLTGSHGLEAWGKRMGFHKGDYMKEMQALGRDPWAAINDEMISYCENDVELNAKLYEMLSNTGASEESVALEERVEELCDATTARGVYFHESLAYELYSVLCQERAKAEAKLVQVFGSWEETEIFIPKRDNKTRGYKAGVPFPKVTTVQFNPASRQHIAKRLGVLHGWKPVKKTANGQPVVDEKVLKSLPYPEVKHLLHLFMINKRIGMLAEGDNAWIKLVKEGRIHGKINTNAAITGRATHSRPNLAQVPSVGSEYGADCRALFGASKGMVLVGADAAGLELRCLAHFLAHYDGGEYAEIVLKGDIHTANQKAAGLPTRDAAKTFIYALLYGAGDFLIGGGNRNKGNQLRKKFMEAIPAYRKLVKGVTKAAKERGVLKGLDGRKLHVRYEHAALNTLLQAAGAIIMKKAMVLYHEDLEAKGIEFHQVLWVHDEFQVECYPADADAVGQAMVDAIRAAGEHFNFKCPLDGEYKIGSSWADTH